MSGSETAGLPGDLAHMLVCGAVRYYLGRQTGAAHAVADGLAALASGMREDTRGVLARGVGAWLEEHPGYVHGGIDDAAPWRRLMEQLGKDGR